MKFSSRDIAELHRLEREADIQDTDIKRLWKRMTSFPQVYPGVPHGIPMFPSTTRTTDTGTTETATSNTTGTGTTATFTTDTFTTFTADCYQSNNPCRVRSSYDIEFRMSQVLYGYQASPTVFVPTSVAYNCASATAAFAQSIKNKTSVSTGGCAYDIFTFLFTGPMSVTVGGVTVDADNRDPFWVPTPLNFTVTLHDLVAGHMGCGCPVTWMHLPAYTHMPARFGRYCEGETGNLGFPAHACEDPHPGLVGEGWIRFTIFESSVSCNSEIDPCTGLPFPDGFVRAMQIKIQAFIL